MKKKLFRSVLFVPADRPKAIEKAVFTLKPDVIILDLEDAVSPDNKLTARANLQAFAKKIQSDPKDIKSQIVARINCPITTEWGLSDLQALKNFKSIDRFVIPKVDDENVINKVQEEISGFPVWTMIETAKGVLNSNRIAAIPHVEALVYGINDLSKDLRVLNLSNSLPGLPSFLGTLPLWFSMSQCVVAARASGKVVIDGVYMDITNNTGLHEACVFGRSMGFDGKSLIHPSQIPVCNQAFSPSPEEVNQARRIVSAYEEAIGQGKSLAVLDGKLIELLHVLQARDILTIHEAVSTQ